MKRLMDYSPTREILWLDEHGEYYRLGLALWKHVDASSVAAANSHGGGNLSG